MDKKKDLLNQKMFEILNNEILDLEIKNCDANITTVKVAELADRITEIIAPMRIARKPIDLYSENEYGSENTLLYFGKCSHCKHEIQPGMNYCFECGQAIDWSDISGENL